MLPSPFLLFFSSPGSPHASPHSGKRLCHRTHSPPSTLLLCQFVRLSAFHSPLSLIELLVSSIELCATASSPPLTLLDSSPLFIFPHTTLPNLPLSLFLSTLLSIPDESDVDGKSIEKRAVARVKTVTPDMYHQQIGYCNKSETCVLYPKVPKAWLENGFIIIPSLSEKGGS